MALDPRLETVREKYGLARDDFWELPQKKGTWIAKHSALEVAAAKAGIQFDNPITIEAQTEAGIAVLSVTGVMSDRREWATGEASPKNNKNAYPWAMAEKRAKDRVILKLIGIHGLVYSDAEGDFRDDAPAAQPMGKISAYRAKQLLKTDVLLSEIDGATEKHVGILRELFTTELSFLPPNWTKMFLERLDQRTAQLDSDDHQPPVDPNSTLDRQFAETMRE